MQPKQISEQKPQNILMSFIQEMNKTNDVNDFFASTLDLIANYFSFSSTCIFVQNLTFSEKPVIRLKNYYVSSDFYSLHESIDSLQNVNGFYNDFLSNNQHVFFTPKTLEKKNINFSISDKYQLDSFLLIPLIYREKHFGTLVCHQKNCIATLEKEIINLLQIIGIQYGIFLNEIQLKIHLKQKDEINTNLHIKTSKTEYLLQMNHELRTPMTAVIGFAKMLKQEIYGQLNPKQSQYVKAIYDSGVYLLELINDLLDITKLEADKEELFIENILVKEICLSCLSLVQEKANEQKLILNLEIDDGINSCYADARKIKQILVNLLSNAVKFTEKGTITLKVEKTNDYLDFSVIDTGIGIKEIDQKKLFKPFLQLKNNLNRKHKGSGLGLILSAKLAKLHGGDITLISEEKKGSCFTFHLPLNNENKKSL